MQQAHVLLSGTTLKNGEYLLAGLLGQGGFGITYKATQTSLGRTVVVKEFFMDGKCTRSHNSGQVNIQSLSPEDFETYKDRFFEEAKLLAQFGNLPGIVNVIDFFRENNTVYFAMDFITGDTLQQYLLRQPGEKLTPFEATKLIRKVAQALGPVHAQNVLHRDLKPANIIRQPNGEPVVLDFGAARAFISDRTAFHSVILTPGYAPPEQYGSSGRHGPATDIYALGAVLYRLLTGSTPPPSPDRIIEDLVPPHDHDPSIPRGLSDVVMKAMALKPENRYANMSLFADALSENEQYPKQQEIAAPSPANMLDPRDQPTLQNDALLQGPLKQGQKEKEEKKAAEDWFISDQLLIAMLLLIMAMAILFLYLGFNPINFRS